MNARLLAGATALADLVAAPAVAQADTTVTAGPARGHTQPLGLQAGARSTMIHA
jgi:hypothetical protein